MARVNFDDSVYKSGNYAKLLLKLGCVYTTKGMLVSAWELAQMYWLEHRAVPIDNWPDELNILIETKFARYEQRAEGAFVYVSGSSEFCAFLEQKSNAGKKGGKSKSPKKLQNLKQNQKTPKRDRSETETSTEAKPKRTEASSSVSISISSSISDSNSGSDSNLIPAEIEISPQAGGFDPKKKTSYFLAQYADRFKQRHGANPEIAGKDAGIATRLIKTWGQDKIDLYLEAYFAMPDAWVVKAKHPIALLESKINEVAVFANTGNFTTRTQVNQADSIASNMILLEKVRKNSV